MQFHAVHHRIIHQRRFRQILFTCIVFTIILGFLIVPIESQHPQAKILSASDGLWWAVQTATTVGYGDVVPVTELGRVIGIIMQLLGSVMFGSLLAIISTSMSRGQEEFFWNRLFDRIDKIDERIDKIESQTRYLVKSDVEEK